MYENNFSSDEMLKTMREESRLHEENLEHKIKEETDKLKNTLKKIKKEMEKFSNTKSHDKEEDLTQQAQENSLNNIDLISAEDTLRKIRKSPELSEIPNNTEKSPSVKDTNSMNNTANNKFFNPKQETNNDSALSSFHIHNLNNNKDKLKIPNNLKEKTIKIPKRENDKASFSKNNFNMSIDSKHSKRSDHHSKKQKKEKESFNTSHSENTDHNNNNKKFSGSQDERDHSKKKIQINSLSLSISKDKELESDKEYREEYDEYSPEDKIQKNTEKSYRKELEHDYNEITSHNLNDFSKSGTFKSQSAANYDSKNSFSYNNIPDPYNYTDNPSIKNNLDHEQTKSNYNFSNKINRYNASNYSNSNFYKETGKNFSETISDLQSIGKEIKNNQSSYMIDHRNFNENRTISNFNLNNSTINEMIKKDLYEYLSNLENKQMVKVNTNKKNEWIVQFKGDATEDISIKKEDGENDEKEESLRDYQRYNQDNNKNKSISYNHNNNNNSNNKSNSISLQINTLKRNNSVNIDQKIIKQKKEFSELRNQVEILKKEKQGLQRYLKDKEKENSQNNHIRSLNRSVNKSMNKNKISGPGIEPTKTKITSDSKTNCEKNTMPIIEKSMKNDDYYSNNSNSYFNTNIDKSCLQNTNYNSTSKLTRDNLNLKQYEYEVLEKIKNEDMFSQVSENYTNNRDHLGDFIDRVIERSLFIYKNKNCHTCSRLLSTGKSTRLCPKNH